MPASEEARRPAFQDEARRLKILLLGHSKKSAHALEQERRDWFEGQGDLDPAKLVLSTRPACRADMTAPMTAPFVGDGAMNGAAFQAYWSAPGDG